MRRLLVAAVFCFVFFASAVVADELIIFSLPGCPPCARLAALLKRQPDLVADYRVSMIDMAADPESARLFRVRSAPTIVRLDAADKEVGRLSGAPSAATLRQWLSRPNR